MVLQIYGRLWWFSIREVECSRSIVTYTAAPDNDRFEIIAQGRARQEISDISLTEKRPKFRDFSRNEELFN
jgi:hypothetical protein